MNEELQLAAHNAPADEARGSQELGVLPQLDSVLSAEFSPIARHFGCDLDATGQGTGHLFARSLGPADAEKMLG